MAKEPKGFRNSSGQRLARDIPISTKAGIIIYKGKGDAWYLEFPDMTSRIGGVTTIKLMSLIYYLEHTNGNLDKSRELVGF
jgi:hypothetical protein